MFCDMLPCECTGAPKKAAPKKKRATPHIESFQTRRPIETVELPEPAIDPMRAAMKNAAANPQPRVEALPVLNLEEQAALEVLLSSDILHPDEVAKWGHLAGTKARTQLWKRAGEVTHGRDSCANGIL